MDSGSPAMLVKTSLSPYPPSSSFMNETAQPTHLYIHQQPPIGIIQLIEVLPPPPRSHHYTSTMSSSSFASSCHSSGNDLEEDESICSSYCSSEDNLGVDQALTYDDTYKTRLHRILVWRDRFTKATAVENADEETPATVTAPPSSPISSSFASSLKRKSDHESRWESDDGYSSWSSKRPRSLSTESRQDSEHVAATPLQQLRQSLHCCPACDSSFATLKSLKQHGQQPGLNEACREAVEYGLES